MIAEEIASFWKLHAGEHGEFGRIPKERRRNESRDLCAFLILADLNPYKSHDIISSSDHDVIWISVEPESVLLTEEIMLDLVRCGVCFGDDAFYMFV